MKRLLAIALMLGASVAAQAATPYTETFSGGTPAPGSSLSLGAGSWNYTGGVAQVKFSNTSPLGIPDIATLRPGNGLFTGDYHQAGIGVMGFRFKSGVALPSVVYVELKTATETYQRQIPVSQVGAWESFMISLSSAEEGGWTAKEGRTEDFASALSDVKSVAIMIQRSGATGRDYSVDDFYVDGLPQAAGAGMSASEAGAQLSWGILRVGSAYTVQEGASLSGPWKDVSTSVATSTLHEFVVPPQSDKAQSFFRLRGP